MELTNRGLQLCFGKKLLYLSFEERWQVERYGCQGDGDDVDDDSDDVVYAQVEGAILLRMTNGDVPATTVFKLALFSGQSYKAHNDRNLQFQSCTDYKFAHITILEW